ncbi:MAG: hypothetical protein ACRDVN_09745, partial [Jiangellaceae bacterium]
MARGMGELNLRVRAIGRVRWLMQNRFRFLPAEMSARGGDRRQVVRRRLLLVVAGLVLIPATLIYLPPAEVVAAPTTLVVNSTVDAADTNPGDGVCATGAGTCTLR